MRARSTTGSPSKKKIFLNYLVASKAMVGLPVYVRLILRRGGVCLENNVNTSRLFILLWEFKEKEGTSKRFVIRVKIGELFLYISNHFYLQIISFQTCLRGVGELTLCLSPRSHKTSIHLCGANEELWFPVKLTFARLIKSKFLLYCWLKWHILT